MVSDPEIEGPTDPPPAEPAGDTASENPSITQALKPWRPATRRRVDVETLAILTWPQGVALESPAFEHFLASVVAPFCARYPTQSTQLLYRRSLTYFFRWWGQAREQEGESDSFSAQLLQRYRAFLTQTEGVGTGTKLAARTINTYLASLRAFCTWLKRTGQIPYHPMREVKGLKLAKRFVRDSLTEAEVSRLMDTFDLTGIDQAAQERRGRDYAMTLL